MPIKVGVGFSQNADAEVAALEATDQAKAQLKQSRIDFALLFNTVHYDPSDFLPIVYQTLDKTKLMGCSTPGIILPDRIETRGIGVVIVTSDDVRFEAGHVDHIPLQDVHMAGKSLVKECITDFGQKYRKIFLLFTDGLINNIPSFIDGMKEQLPNGVPIIGAGSHDPSHSQKTYQYFQKNWMNQGAVGVILGGRLLMGLSCRHGWKPLGKPRTVDQATDKIIKSISGQKASQIYQEYFGNEALMLQTVSQTEIQARYPLGVHTEDSNQYTLRPIVQASKEGHLICQDAVPIGARIHMMIGNKDFCLQAVEEAALEVKEQLEGRKPHFILILESLLRYKILGRMAFREIQIIKNILGAVPIFGMYSHNEIFSSARTTSQVQNGSIIILAIG